MSRTLTEYARKKLRPSQREALDRMHDGCVLLARPGAGKTITALSYWLRAHGSQQLVIVTTPAKRDAFEWQEDAAKLAVIFPDDAIVTSWNKIKDLEKLDGCFVIFDEQKASGRGKWANAFVKIARNNDWIMLSATPGDVWMDWSALFIANGFYRNKTDFYDQHVLWDTWARYPRVKGYRNVRKLRRNASCITVFMSVKRAAERLTEDVTVDFDRELYTTVTKKRWDPFKERPMRDAGALCSVQRKIVCISEDRAAKAKEVISKHERIIVFYSYNAELEQLKRVCSELGRPVYERNGQKHDPVPGDGSWVYLVQYLAADAWNCTSTDASLFYSLPYSWRQMEQAYGRIDRMNTPYEKLHYYRLVSDSGIDKAVARALLRKGKFNEKTYADSLGFSAEDPDDS